MLKFRYSFLSTISYSTNLSLLTFEQSALICPLEQQTLMSTGMYCSLRVTFQHPSRNTRAVTDTVQCTSASVNSSGTKGLPDNGFTDVGGNKEGNTRPQAVTLL